MSNTRWQDDLLFKCIKEMNAADENRKQRLKQLEREERQRKILIFTLVTVGIVIPLALGYLIGN